MLDLAETSDETAIPVMLREVEELQNGFPEVVEADFATQGTCTCERDMPPKELALQCERPTLPERYVFVA